MKVSAIKNHVTPELYQELKNAKNSSAHIVKLLVFNKDAYTQIEKAVRVLELEKLSDSKKKQVEELAKRVAEAAKFKIDNPMAKEYAAEVKTLKIKNIEGHFNPAKTIKDGKSIADFQKKWKKSKTKRPFNEWIQEKLENADVKKIKQIEVKYLTKSEKKEYEVSFKKDKIENTALGDSATGKFIYVLGQNHKLYIASETGNNLKHSSFFRGAPVICAGQVVLEKGKLKKFDNQSGHYKTTQEMMENLRLFLEDQVGKKKAKKLI